jgi:DNA-binding NtrC family response regulator
MERQVVIVARDAQVRRALGRLCRGRGCRVETVRSLKTTLEITSRIPTGVLVVDVSVQDLDDGVDLARAIHERNPDAKCFLIANRESSDVIESAEDEPWLHVVHKPIPMLRFASDVADAIAKSQMGD